MATGLFNLKQVNQAISQGAWSGYIAPKWVEYLVVAGGGGGGYTGGGGAGGVLTGIVTVAAGVSYTVTIGPGGTGDTGGGYNPTKGTASVFGSISATGGGAGISNYIASASQNTGGSGGGGGLGNVQNGQGTFGQGNAGGLSSATNGGGGGGAGTVGLAATTYGGNGGAGIASAITGSVVTYGGGGGGGFANSINSNPGLGGVGGGGNAGISSGGVGGSGGGNTGGGGGASVYVGPTYYAGGNGGSGIVVVRYPGSIQFFTGGTLSYANGYMIHTFYSSGTLAPTTPTPYVTDYQISRSLRFNSADSAYLNRTPASATNQKTWTWSGWIKRGKLDVTQYTVFTATGGQGIRVNDDSPGNQIRVRVASLSLIFTPVLRDPSAWYHIVVSVDTTQATSSDRVKLYINNQLASLSSGTYPSQNADTGVNAAVAHFIGAEPTPSQYYDGLMTELNFIDGQALTPSSFGYTDPDTGVWSPLAFVGTYGTNGFYVNFSDNSNTTAATLGKDYSGNGNNWTPNNFSVTAGSGNDSLVDSPTSYGTDTGVGGEVRGNYATMNPLSQYGCTFANGNLDTTLTTTASPQSESAVSTFGVSSGKWYCEIVSTSGPGPFIGIADASLQAAGRTFNSSSVWSYYVSGSKYNGGTATAYGASWTTNDVMGIALDMDAGTVTFYKNGASQGVAFSGLTGRSIVAWVSTGTGSVGSVLTFVSNFGQRPFAYTAPSGFKALCTQNLPTPTIGATTATQAGKYFNPVLWTGNGSSSIAITGVGFQPDFVWTKQRDIAQSHSLYDVIRGGSSSLASNSTVAQDTATTYGVISTFDADGITATKGSDPTYSYFNKSGGTYVAWNWKANGSGSTNTAGSITSTVSANTTSGFSVVTYTGNSASDQTVGHGLGVTPSMVIVKSRGSADPWVTYQSVLGANKFLYLNTTDAESTVSGYWGTPSSTTFGIKGGGWANNVNGVAMVAYCFAEVAGYSKFGSYTGNGSSDGAFVFTGMRPAYVMIKRTSSTGDWFVYNNKTSPSNAVNLYLVANTSGAEGTYATLDFLSNGFKLRVSDAEVNGSGSTFIYMAFAEAPQKFSLAR